MKNSNAQDQQATSKNPFKDRAISRAKPGTTIRDTVIAGLHARAFDGGTSFYLHYRTKDGTERRPKLGAASVLSVAEARRIARDMLAAVAAGRDPVAERKRAKTAPIIADLAARYMREHGKQKKTGREDQRQIDRYILPAIGRVRVFAAEYDDINALHESMRETPYQANRTAALLHNMFNFAERWKYRPRGSNPCNVRRFPERKRRRYAKPPEVALMGPILEREEANNPTGVAFLRLLMLTGARPSEIERAPRRALERVLRADKRVAGVLRLDGKTGEGNVYFPPEAMDVVDKLPRSSDPDATLTGRLMPRRLWRRIRREIGAPDLWARDFRRLFATVGLSNGQSKGIVGELLNHASEQTTSIYAKLLEDAAHNAAGDTAERVTRMLKSA